jgi:hypothetical protein
MGRKPRPAAGRPDVRPEWGALAGSLRGVRRAEPALAMLELLGHGPPPRGGTADPTYPVPSEEFS